MSWLLIHVRSVIGIHQAAKRNEVRGILGLYQMALSSYFDNFFSPDSSVTSQNAPHQAGEARSHVPGKHTAFDQSLIPLSAVVKRCALEIFGPIFQSRCVGTSSTAWRMRTSRWDGPSCCRERRHLTRLNPPDLHGLHLLVHLGKHNSTTMCEKAVWVHQIIFSRPMKQINTSII